jgi:hypothetical protein
MVESNNFSDPAQENIEQSQPPAETLSAGGGGQNWKTAMFVVVILVAGAVAGHSLLKNDRAAPKGSSCGGDPACAACPFSKPAAAEDAGQSGAQSAAGQTANQQMPCCQQQSCPSNDKACCPDSVCPAGAESPTAQPAPDSCAGCPFAAGGCGAKSDSN